MQILMQYINAIKNLNKKYYFTPILITFYASSFFFIWQGGKILINFDIVLFIVSFFKAATLSIIRTICYPHANFFIQTSWLYRKIFGSTWDVVKSGLATYAKIGKDIPDDYYIHGPRGTYTISSGYKRKTDRVGDMKRIYAFYLAMKFLFKDILLRVGTHIGIFAISPILFLIAIPILKKRGLLTAIEKSHNSKKSA